jgi:hypothetical protein
MAGNRTVEYPTGVSAFNEIILKSITAYKDDNDIVQDMSIFATGNVSIGCEDDKVIDIKGDLVLNSNLVLNGTTYMNDANIFKVFDNDFTISYGFNINNRGILELYKHDSRVNNSTVVMSFGNGNISSDSRPSSETATTKIDSILNKKDDSPNIFGKSLSNTNDIIDDDIIDDILPI